MRNFFTALLVGISITAYSDHPAKSVKPVVGAPSEEGGLEKGTIGKGTIGAEGKGTIGADGKGSSDTEAQPQIAKGTIGVVCITPEGREFQQLFEQTPVGDAIRVVFKEKLERSAPVLPREEEVEEQDAAKEFEACYKEAQSRAIEAKVNEILTSLSRKNAEKTPSDSGTAPAKSSSEKE